jgi:bifunctional non-homologous end joining protein LigD
VSDVRASARNSKIFVLPSFPTLRNVPPSGPDWLHEIKFDGYRVQLHKIGKDVVIYSRRGADFTTRYQPIADALAELSVRSVIIDAELVVALPNGVPDFRALHSRKFDPATLAIWAFDLLQYNGNDLREHPLTVRKLKMILVRRSSSGTHKRALGGFGRPPPVGRVTL